MTRVLLDRVIQTDYGQFELLWGDDEYLGFDGDWDRFFDGQLNGLVGAADEQGLYVSLSRRSGGSPVRIVLLDDAPELGDEWEDIVEVSITVPPGAEPSWRTWTDQIGGRLDLPPGTYRVRTSARGRDAGHVGELADGPVDHYLLEIWPASARPDSILRTTSADARHWHRDIGSRRRHRHGHNPRRPAADR